VSEDDPEMTHDMIILDVLVRGIEGRVDVVVRDGRIDAIGPGLGRQDRGGLFALDGAGHVLLPGLVDAHSHLDKSLIGMPWYHRPAGRGLQQMLADERELRHGAEWDYERQISRNLEVLIAAGATHTRAFVDIDTRGELRGLDAMLAVRERYAHAVTMHVIAFAQSGISAWPGTIELLEEALLRGADALGGIDPALVERDPAHNLDLLFGMAARHGVQLDIHLHEPGPLGAFSAELIVERTRSHQLGGSVVISHPNFLAGIPADHARRLAEVMADAGIAVTTNASGSQPGPPLALMREAGLTVGAGCDGELDSWAPFNRSDMLFKGYLLAWRNDMGTDDDLDQVYDLIATGGAAIMGEPNHGVHVGAAADFVMLPGDAVIAPLVALPAERVVVKSGRVVVRGGRLLPH
jgi:cytosine deaminase